MLLNKPTLRRRDGLNNLEVRFKLVQSSIPWTNDNLFSFWTPTQTSKTIWNDRTEAYILCLTSTTALLITVFRTKRQLATCTAKIYNNPERAIHWLTHWQIMRRFPISDPSILYLNDSSCFQTFREIAKSLL